MFQQNNATLVRLGILALPLAGVLGLVGVLGRYGAPNPKVDPRAAARTAASTGYFLTQMIGNVLGLTLLLLGVFALTVFLANTRARAWAIPAMVLSIAGIAPVLSAIGITTYALPVLGHAYLNGQQDVLPIINQIFNNPHRIIFDFVFVAYAAGYILFGVAIWRSDVLRKPAAISIGLHAPLVSSFIKPQPNFGVLLGAALFILGSTMVAIDVIRGPSSRRRRNTTAKTSGH
jgi:hypothetical protein